ncbi:unnamed protein product [Symbiodinium sp. CCMP2592]|nr:unnamed protein product [Symbiodinium sp. CCMP2592]
MEKQEFQLQLADARLATGKLGFGQAYGASGYVGSRLPEAGDKLMLKDENVNCRRIALDALKEKNGYKEPAPPCFVVARATAIGHPWQKLPSPAEHRHLGFLTEGEELENQEHEDPGSTRDSRSAREAVLCEAVNFRASQHRGDSGGGIGGIFAASSDGSPDSGEQVQQEELPRPHRASGPGWLYLYGEALLPRAADGRMILKNEDMVAAYTAHFGQTPTPEQLRNWVKNSHGQAISYKEARNLIASAKEAKKQALLPDHGARRLGALDSGLGLLDLRNAEDFDGGPVSRQILDLIIPGKGIESLLQQSCCLTGLSVRWRLVFAFSLNAIWLPIYVNLLFGWALLVIILYLAFFFLVYVDLNTMTVDSFVQWVVYAAGIACNASWVLVATAANKFTFLGELGWKDVYGVAGTPGAAVLVVAFVASIAIIVASVRSDFAWSLVAVWALAGLYRQQTVPDSSSFPPQALNPTLAKCALWAAMVVGLATFTGLLMLPFNGAFRSKRGKAQDTKAPQTYRRVLTMKLGEEAEEVEEEEQEEQEEQEVPSDGTPSRPSRSSRKRLPPAEAEMVSRALDQPRPKQEPEKVEPEMSLRSGGLQLRLHFGTIRSFDANKGFGFIDADGFSDDVFFWKKELREATAEPTGTRLDEVIGKRVAFQVRQMPDDKFRARQVSIVLKDLPSRASCVIRTLPRSTR